MLPLVSRMGIVIIASFTLTMLLAATADWALRQAGGGLPVKLILSVRFPITFFLCSIVMEYIEEGNLAHSVRASLFNTGFRWSSFYTSLDMEYRRSRTGHRCSSLVIFKI